MSKLIVREKLRDLFKNMVSAEEALEIKDALDSLYGLFLTRNPFLTPMLIRYAEGFTVDELAIKFDMPREEVGDHLRYAYALLGELLSLDDAIVIRRVDPLQREVAATILNSIYIEDKEL